VTDGDDAGAVAAESGGGDGALAGVGIFGDDVNDAVDGVGAPQGAGGSALDFDAAQVFQDEIEQTPVVPGGDLTVNGAAVFEDEEFARSGVVKAADVDGVAAAVEAEGLDEGGRAAVGDVSRDSTGAGARVSKTAVCFRPRVLIS